MVNDDTGTTADVIASNGIVHIIDKVLLPVMLQKCVPFVLMALQSWTRYSPSYK